MRKLSYQQTDPKSLNTGDPFSHAGEHFTVTEPEYCGGLILAKKPRGKKVYVFEVVPSGVTRFVGVQ